MPLQAVIRRLDGKFPAELFGTIKASVSEYLSRCKLRDPTQFSLWCLQEQAHWVSLEDGGLILTDWRPGLLVRVHPLVWGRKMVVDRDYQQEVLRWVARTCKVKRVEALVPLEAPRGLSRWCYRSGLRYEGTLRSATQWRGVITDGLMFAFVEA